MTNTFLAPDRQGLAEEQDAEPLVHHQPDGFADRFALGFTKLVRADEAHHRDVNHGYSSKLGGVAVDRAVAAPYPEHADDIRVNA